MEKHRIVPWYFSIALAFLTVSRSCTTVVQPHFLDVSAPGLIPSGAAGHSPARDRSCLRQNILRGVFSGGRILTGVHAPENAVDNTVGRPTMTTIADCTGIVRNT